MVVWANVAYLRQSGEGYATFAKAWPTRDEYFYGQSLVCTIGSTKLISIKPGSPK